MPGKFVELLESWLPEVNRAELIAALRQDDKVWEAVQQQGFIERMAAHPEGYWNPAGIFALTAGLPFGALRDGISSLHVDQIQKAFEDFRDCLRNNKPPVTLEDSGWLAIALREQWKNGELHDIDQMAFETWRTPMACLFGIFADGKKLLNGLLLSEHKGVCWAVHAILTNFRHFEDQKRIFLDLLQDKSVSLQVDCLKIIGKLGYRELQKKTAIDLISLNDQINEQASKQSNPTLGNETGWQIVALRDRATLYQIAGQSDVAVTNLAAVEDSLRYWMAAVNIQHAEAAFNHQFNGAAQQAAGRAVKLAPEIARIADQAVFILDSDLWKANGLNGAGLSPIAQIKMASVLSKKGKQERGLEMAKIAAQQWVVGLHDDPAQELVLTDPSIEALQILLDFGLPVDAKGCFEGLVSKRPNDVDLLRIGSRIYEMLDEIDTAIETIRMVLVYQPNVADHGRYLAGLLEKQADWQRAVKEWMRVGELPAANRNDYLHLAQCAILAGEPEIALVQCQSLIETDPDSGMAHALMGEALLAMGQKDDGIQHLGLATLLNPEEPNTWLKLVRAYQDLDEKEKSLETLRAAIAVVGDSGAIQFALGKMLVDAGSVTESLMYLRKAYDLERGNVEHALYYSQALSKLGFHAEAKQVVAEAVCTAPDEPRLAAMQGELLSAEGEYLRALESWEKAVTSESALTEWNLGYAACLLGLSNDQVENRLQKVEASLRKVLATNRENFQGRFLLGKLFVQQHENEAAFSIFSQLVELPDCAEADWPVTVNLEMGRTARSLGLFEAAISAYQEILNDHPGETEIKMELAEALQEAGVHSESLRVAREVRPVLEKEVNALRWFGKLALKCGEPKEAIIALEMAVENEPENWKAWLDLAAVLIHAGDKKRAAEIMNSFSQNGKHAIEEWWLAAVLYEKLALHKDAYVCLENVSRNIDAPSIRLFVQMALIAQKCVDLEKALTLLNQSAELEPDCAPIMVFQADLLAELRRPQAAVIALEQSFNPVSDKLNFPIGKWEDPELPYAIIPENWFEKMAAPAGIQLRIAQIQYQLGNITNALQTAEKVLHICPQTLAARVLAVDAAITTMELTRAKNLLAAEESSDDVCESGESFSNLDPDTWRAGLLALQAELYIENGEYTRAEEKIKAGLELVPDCPRLLIGRVRCLAEKGEYASARTMLETAVSLLENKTRPAKKYQHWGDEIVMDRFYRTYPLWMGEAFNALGRWQEGVNLLEQYVDQNPGEARGLYTFVRRMIELANLSDIFRVVEVADWLPVNLLGEEKHLKVESAINSVSRMINSEMSTRLLAMENVVFHPNSHNLRTLSSVASMPEEAGFLAAGWRKAGNIQELQKLYELYPDHIDVILQYAAGCVGKNLNEGIAASRKVCDLQPTWPIGHALSAALYEKAGDLNNAIESLNKALDLWHDLPSWFAWAGRLNKGLGRHEEAEAYWEQAVALCPGQVDYLLGLADASLQDQNPTRAIDAGLNATKLDPERLEAWLLLSEAYRASGDLENAFSCAKHACELSADRFEPRMLAGEIALQMGNLDQAARYSQSAMVLAPKEGSAVKLMVDIYSNQGQYETALGLLDQSIPLVDDLAPLNLERARLIRKVRGAKEAIPTLAGIVKETPYDYEAWAELAKAEAEIPDVEAAIEAANRALRLRANQPDLTILMGKMCLNAGHLDKAIQFFTDTIQQHQNHVDAYLDLGKAYILQRRTGEAMRVYAQGMRAAPNDYRPFYFAALAQREVKEYSEAESLLRKASQLAPDNIVIRRQLAAVIALNMVYQAQEASS